jgi:predicted nucleotidyltransferase
MNAAELERIARTHGIRLLLQFGSTVTGHVHARSDVDLAVLLDRPSLTLEARAALVHDLQALFPGVEVDLGILNHADPLFLKKVTDTCRLLQGTPAELRRLQLLAFRRYQDHRKYFDLERRFVADAVTGPAGRG